MSQRGPGGARDRCGARVSRLNVLYVCDALEGGKAGGLVAAGRLIAALQPHHHVRTVGVGGEVPMRAIEVPWVSELARQNGFVFARPDAKALREAVAWADVVHLQLPTWLSFRALGLARLLGKPVVAAHHLQPENLLHNVGIPSAWLARWLNRLLVRRYFEQADSVVCPTAFALNELRAAGLTVRASVISNGVPARFVPAERREPCALFRIVSVGRHAHEKKHAVLIDAVLQMKNRARVSLLLGGRGPLTAKLSRQAQSLGAQVQVRFIEDDALVATYQQAELLVHPSDVELEGLAVAEAVACGTPVLVSDARSSAARQFAHDRRFLFEAGNPADLARRLDHWVEHPSALEALRGAQASRGATTTLGLAAAAMASLYDELARRGPRALFDGRPGTLAPAA